MSLFYQRGRILHFFRSFSIFRQGSCLISLYPIFSHSFSELSLSFPSLSYHSNPVSSISCDVPEFSPLPLSRTLEKCAFLQSAVTVSSSIASQKLYWSSAEALRMLYRSSIIQLLNKPAANLLSLQLIYYLLISRQKGILLLSSMQHYTALHALALLAYSTLYNQPARPIEPNAAFPHHFHILPTMPRIRIRMLCTGFLYSSGIISHSYVKIDYRSILSPERKWFFDSKRISPYLLYHRGVSTHKYSRPRSNGQLYLFLYYYYISIATQV